MSYSAEIRNYISQIPLGEIITTRQVLSLGTRGAVDMTLSRMVQSHELIRVAWGAFVRKGSVMPSVAEVILAKAQAFGRTIASHGTALAQGYGLLPKDDAPAPLCISAGTTAFFVFENKKRFASTCDRKRHLGESPAGRAIRALWRLGEEDFRSLPYQRLIDIQRLEKIQLVQHAAWMPSWMSDRLVQRM